MKFIYRIGLVVLFSAFIAGCKKSDNTVVPANDGPEYFSNVIGMTRIYQVDSIYWDDFNNTHDTVSYQVKETIPSTFLDNQGRTTQRIERYLKDSTGNWVIWKVWASNVTATTAEQVEDNNRYLKITFSPELNATWNGNTFNSLDADDYKITALNVPDSKGNLNFTSTLTVMQNDDDNLVYRKYDEERYAKGAGLYYRTNIDVEKIFGTEDIKSGYIYTETLLSYSITP